MRTMSITLLTPLTPAIALTLRTDVVAQQRSKHEVLFGRELVERTVDHQPYGIEALLATEKEVHAPTVAHGLYQVVDALMLEPLAGKLLVTAVAGEEHHAAHAFLVLVDVVHQHFHVVGLTYFVCHTCRVMDW